MDRLNRGSRETRREEEFLWGRRTRSPTSCPSFVSTQRGTDDDQRGQPDILGPSVQVQTQETAAHTTVSHYGRVSSPSVIGALPVLPTRSYVSTTLRSGTGFTLEPLDGDGVPPPWTVS